MARGELIAYCDDDDALRPRHVELLVAALKANPRAGFAYTQMICHNPGGSSAGTARREISRSRGHARWAGVSEIGMVRSSRSMSLSEARWS